MNKINHDIDVRYEGDVIKAFDKFIEKWCGDYSKHLLDDDENDGEFMRNKIKDLLAKAPEKEMEKCGCGCHDSAHERELGIVKYCTKCINSYHLKIEEIEPLEPSWGDRTKINELVAAINSLAKRLKEVESSKIKP